MNFKDEFKQGWKGHAGTTPAPSLLEALARNEGFKQRSSLKSVLGLTTSALSKEEPILWACSGSKKEGKVTFFAILLVMQDRVILAQHSYLQSVPKFEVSEIPLNKISNVRVRKDKTLFAEIIIETSGANLVMSSTDKWLENLKAVLLEKIESPNSFPGPPSKEPKSLSTELLQLAQLLNDGILTPEEFQIAKVSLLGGDTETKEEPPKLSEIENIVIPNVVEELNDYEVLNLETKVLGTHSTRKKIIVGLCVALLVIAIPVNNNFQESRRVSAEKETAELEAQTINDAFTAELLRTNFTDCESVQDIASASVYPEFDDLSLRTKEITDPREALSFVSTNQVRATALVAKYESLLDTKLRIGLDSVFSTSDRDERATDTQLAAWRSQWKDAVLTSCNLLAENTSVKASLQKLDSEFKRITLLANSVPWYPEGFSEFDANTAYKYTNDGCDYFDCYNVAIISKVPCSQIYAEMTLMDSTGANVGYTNDTTSSVQSLQVVKLRFDVFESSAEKGRLTQVSCY